MDFRREKRNEKWFCLPLQEKLKYLTFSVGAVVFFSIAANMLVAFSDWEDLEIF